MRAVAAVGAVLLLVAGPLVTTASAEESVSVTMTADDLDLQLGAETTLSITVVNETATPTPALAVHLDITDPSGEGSVDPEDWTSTLTRQVGTVDAGASTTLEWTVQPISGGTFRAYAVVLPVDAGAVDTAAAVNASNSLVIRVEERRSLNPSGILPVAIAAPVVVGGLLLTRLRPLRRR